MTANTLPRALGGAALLSIAVLAVVAVAPLVLGASAEQTLAGALVELTAVLGLVIFVGNTGVLSFGHVAFMAVGAYVSGLLTMSPAIKQTILPELPGFLASAHLHPVAAAVVAMAVVAVLAAVTGVFVARVSGGAAVIVTLGLMVIAHVILIGWSDVTRGNQPLYGVPRDLSVPVALAIAVAAIFAARLFAASRMGLRTRATREDDSAAAAIGISTVRHRLLTWVLSALAMSLAGSMYAHLLGAFSPDQFYFSLTLTLLTMLIVGGMYSVSGAVLGAGVVTVLTEVVRQYETGFRVADVELGPWFGLTDVALAVAILLAMRFRPSGLAGYRELDDVALPRRRRGRITAAEPPEQPRSSRLSASDVTHHFNGVTALDGISLELRTGQILGLIGPNGSGKSTLLAVMSGLLSPSAGTVHIDDRDITGKPSDRIARLGVGRTFQNIRLFEHLTTLENVTSALVAGDRATRAHRQEVEATRLLARLGIEDLADRRAGTLSYGDQRRLEIARALATRPRFLLLDEPAAGMNIEESDLLLSRIREIRDEYGLGLLVVDHDMRLMSRLCDEITVLDHGERVVAGKPDDVLRDPRVAELYLQSARRG